MRTSLALISVLIVVTMLACIMVKSTTTKTTDGGLNHPDESQSKFAIIMGISKYQNPEMSALVYAHNDIEAWFRTLQHRKYAVSVLSDTQNRKDLAKHIGFDESQIHDATEPIIYRHIDAITAVINQTPPTLRTTFVFVCSSHGERLVSASGEVSSSIMAYDIDTGHTNFDNVIHDWELVARLSLLLQNPNVDVIVIVDACFSGGFVNRLMQSDKLGNLTVVSSSTIDKSSFQVKRLRHSALSWFLTQSLPTCQYRLVKSVYKANDDWRKFTMTMPEESRQKVDAQSGLFQIYTKMDQISL